MILKILFWITISLFVLHEMDAVKTREWKMLFLINRLDDNTGHVVFTTLHLPLFVIIFYFADLYFNSMLIIISTLLIFHQLLHIFFRKHPENRMNNIFSTTLIFLIFSISCINILYYFILHSFI